MELSSISIAITSLVGALFSPGAMFTTGVSGAWYDPSDFSTMFQDAAGTAPVTAVGQPVGLMLDKSKGLVLGPELVTNGDFSNGTTGWSSVDAGNSISYLEGELVNTVVVSPSGAQQIITTVAGKTYILSGNIRVTTSTDARIRAVNATFSGTVLAESKVVTSSVATNVSLIFTATSNQTSIYLRSVGIGKSYFSNITVKELPGNHAYNPSGNSANFPVLQQDGTGRYYLAFNGVNQWLQTNPIDFTYGDKMFVSAGVRKLSDATGGVGAQLCGTRNATQPGTFEILSPSSALGTYYLSSGGSLRSAAESSATYPAPITNVLSGIGSISGDQAILRINGTQAAISAADQGAGNYGNYPLYIGARAGSSLWFNGRLYGLVVAGKAASASEITNTEAWLNSKTGAY